MGQKGGVALREEVRPFEQPLNGSIRLNDPAPASMSVVVNRIRNVAAWSWTTAPVRFPGVPTWFSRTPGRVAGPAPQLGADTAEVRAELARAGGTCRSPGNAKDGFS